MDITYKNNKIEKVCTDVKVSDKTYGNEMSEKIQMRIGEIEAAPGIVVGRLQNEGYIKYSMLNELKEYYEIVM